jgi:chromosome segregation ATPase
MERGSARLWPIEFTAMRLSQLREAIARLPAHLGDWTDTTVENLYYDGVCIVIDGDTSEADTLREQVKENEKAAAESDKEAETAVKRAEEAEAECEALREEMAALKDPSEDGESIATYRQRAIDAEENAEKWRELMHAANQRTEEMAKELAAMRKRKGVEPGLMAHSFEVSGFISSVMHYGAENRARMDERAAQTLIRLGDTAKQLSEKIRNTATAGTKRAA